MDSAHKPLRLARQYPYFPLMLLIHICSAIIDAAIAVTLAASALFNVDVNAARLSIVLSLLGTMVPFVLLAPSAALLVQKVKGSRLVVAMVIHSIRVLGLILMGLASANSETTRLAIFPLAFILLTLSKCYVVVKTSALPQITKVENIPFFSSRLSIATGVVSIVIGPLFIGINRVTSESFTLFFAAGMVSLLIGLSVVSYTQLQRSYPIENDSKDAGTNEEDVRLSAGMDLPPHVQVRLIRSLFTFASATRFAIGLLTIGFALHYRDEKFVLALLFLIATLSSFTFNFVAPMIAKSKISLHFRYFALATCTLYLLFLSATSAQIYIYIGAIASGFITAYSRVAYEEQAAHSVPQKVSAPILSRGEVYMQLSWVLGALCAVINFSRAPLAILAAAAIGLALAATHSTATVLKKVGLRF